MRSLLAVPVWITLMAMTAAVTPATVQPVVLRLSHFLGPTSFFEIHFARPWARLLKARADGNLEIYDGSSEFGQVTKQATQAEGRHDRHRPRPVRREGDGFVLSPVIELPFVVHNALDGSPRCGAPTRTIGVSPTSKP